MYYLNTKTLNLAIFLLLFSFFSNAQSLTIKGNEFYLNDQLLPMWGVRVASASQSEENTDQLISVLDTYKSHGINSISIYLQGSSGGFSDPFSSDGRKIDAQHLNRLKRIIKECEKLDMVVVAGIFYQRTMADYEGKRNINSKEAVYNAVETVTKKLRQFNNVIINIANEQNSAIYKKFEPFDFNHANNIIDLCRHIKQFDSNRIVGGGGYNDSLNIIIGKSKFVDVLLFDTFSEDVENNHDSGWHYDYFKKMGVPNKPFVNVELFGGWTRQFVPPGVFTDEGKEIYTNEIDQAAKREGLYVHFHSNVWMQGPSDGYTTRYDLGGNGTKEDPGVKWWFQHLQYKTGKSTKQ